MSEKSYQTDRLSESAEYDRRWSEGHRYSGGHAGYTDHFIDFIKKNVPTARVGQRMLDIGCGAGYFSEMFSKLGYGVEGIDLSRVALTQAQIAVPRGHFQLHDLGKPLPYDAESIDVVWCSEVLEHLFSPAGVVAEAFRVLKPDGLLLLTVPFHGLLKKPGNCGICVRSTRDPEYPHVRFFTKATLSNIVKKACFTMINVTTCGSKLGFRDRLFPTNLLLLATKMPMNTPNV